MIIIIIFQIYYYYHTATVHLPTMFDDKMGI